MKIVILGAPGCVGRTLIKKLDSQEYTITASNRIPNAITGRNPLPVDSVLKELAEEMRKKQ